MHSHWSNKLVAPVKPRQTMWNASWFSKISEICFQISLLTWLVANLVACCCSVHCSSYGALWHVSCAWLMHSCNLWALKQKAEESPSFPLYSFVACKAQTASTLVLLSILPALASSITWPVCTTWKEYMLCFWRMNWKLYLQLLCYGIIESWMSN